MSGRSSELPATAGTGPGRKISSAAVTTILILLLAASATVTAYSLRTLFHNFDVRPVIVARHNEAPLQGDRFDRVLFSRIKAFEYINSFDHVFERGYGETPLANLWVDRCEVRQKDFYKFVRWNKSRRHRQFASPRQPGNWVYSSNSKDHRISGRPEAPANGVSYYDAYAYCKAAGGRLPFGGEWIAAAAGEEQRLYPWGNDFDASGWPYIDPLLNAAQQCALHEETDTPDGIHNLGDAVSEWAQNTEEPSRPTIHGGNAYNAPREIYSLNALYRYAPAKYRSPYVGFRCVYDAPPQPRSPWKTRYNVAKIKEANYSTGIPHGARLPTLLTNLPPDRIAPLERLFAADTGRQADEVLFVMKSEVTREQYDRFLRDPLVRLGLYADKNQPEGHDYRPEDWHRQMRHPQRPVNNIDWWSAYAFASWAGGRLPSADEWVTAASSQGRSVYPWGNEFVADNVLSGEAQLTSAQLTASRGGDVTADGILGMGGNVSEWTQSVDVADGGYIIIVKGGNYLLPGEKTTRVDFRNTVPPGYRSPTLGVRVVFDSRLLGWRQTPS